MRIYNESLKIASESSALLYMPDPAQPVSQLPQIKTIESRKNSHSGLENSSFLL